jgi:hypothetical protein
MNAPTKKDVEELLQTRTGLVEEIANLGRLQESNAASLKDLETNGDLTDRKLLAQIAEDQVMAAMLPRRKAAREESLVALDASLLEMGEKFIQLTLSPRARALHQKAVQKVSARLAQDYSDPHQLARAVHSSDLVRSFLSTPSISSAQGLGAVRFAAVALDRWNELDQLEKKL